MTLFYAPFIRKLKKPFKNGAFSIKERKGYVFKHTDGQQTFYSEASPLPGLSLESIEDIKNGKTCPSLEFALSTLQEDKLYHPIKLSAVIGLDDTQKTFDAIKNGFKTFKLKISPENQEVCLELMENLKIQYPDLKLRLDANGTFTLDQMKRLLMTLENFQIEYFEDPLKNLDEVDKLRKLSPIPLAVDNPLHSLGQIEELINLPFQYYILKPSLIGSLGDIHKLVAKIEEKKKHFILSSLFETEIGLRKIYELASHYNTGMDQGLATLSYFSDHFHVDQPEMVQMPRYSIQEENYLNQLPWEKWPYA